MRATNIAVFAACAIAIAAAMPATIGEADRIELAAIVAGGEVPVLKGPCSTWQTCTKTYADNDLCDRTWTQSTPCPTTPRNCPAPNDKCSPAQGDVEIQLYQCENSNATECVYTSKPCGTVNKGICEVSEILYLGTYYCTGGACQASGAGGKLTCPPWQSCK